MKKLQDRVSTYAYNVEVRVLMDTWLYFFLKMCLECAMGRIDHTILSSQKGLYVSWFSELLFLIAINGLWVQCDRMEQQRIEELDSITVLAGMVRRGGGDCLLPQRRRKKELELQEYLGKKDKLSYLFFIKDYLFLIYS